MKTILVDAVDCFVIEDNGDFRILEEMRDLLESFKNPKVILTNANKEQRERFGLDKMPYEVFSLDHAPEKTDPEYFKKMLQHFDLGSGEVVYFEHNPEAVKSARSAGINTYHYDDGKRDLSSLREFLSQNLS